MTAQTQTLYQEEHSMVVTHWCNHFTETNLIQELYILIEHKIRGEVKHPAVDVLVRPPSQSKNHHPHPWMLDYRHLVVHMEISET